MDDRILIEVCCGGVADAINAQAGGAQRVELNSAVFLGGLTPSLGSLIETKQRVSVPVMVMIRPRPGGFCYSDSEMDVMLRDIDLAVSHGADGIVFAVLTADGCVDVERCSRIMERIGDRQAVFHRAFDVTPDAFETLDQLIDLGVRRVLTSGQKPSALEGAELIAQMIRQVADKIEILPGGGIRQWNVGRFVEETAATQIHVSAFRNLRDSSTQAKPKISFGGSLTPSEDSYQQIDADTVRSLYKALD